MLTGLGFSGRVLGFLAHAVVWIHDVPFIHDVEWPGACMLWAISPFSFLGLGGFFLGPERWSLFARYSAATLLLRKYLWLMGRVMSLEVPIALCVGLGVWIDDFVLAMMNGTERSVVCIQCFGGSWLQYLLAFARAYGGATMYACTSDGWGPFFLLGINHCWAGMVRSPTWRLPLKANASGLKGPPTRRSLM